MDQLKQIFSDLSTRQRLSILAALLLVAGGMWAFVRWKKEADFRPLYTGLSAEDSAQVMQKLKESSVEYRLSDTGNIISVPSARVAELRLELAAAGLPKTGRIGFEIFDKNNLGATEFVEHINYRRALEGELERSVGSLNEVELARVHVTFPKDSVFLDSREPAKASVMVKLRDGARLSPRNVAAISHLVASAVEGLTPDGVSVLDMQGNLLSRPHHSPEDEASEAALEYRQKIERDLLQKVNTTLEPLLGHDGFRAGVSAEVDLTSGEQSEETFDPTRSIMTSSQKTEENTAGATAAGVPGTASNLPRPTSRPGAGGVTNMRRTEDVKYETSRVVRKTKIPQGTLKRLSVAVLVDQSVRWEGTGAAAKRVLTPPTPEVMKSVHDVVAAVVGFSQQRGDQITVESLAFEATRNQPQPGVVTAPRAGTVAPPPAGLNSIPRLWLAGGAGALLLLLLIVGVLMMRGKPKGKAHADTQHALPGAANAAAGTNGLPVIEGAATAQQIEARLAEQAALQEQADLASLASIKLPKVTSKKSEVLAKQLRENSKKDPAIAAAVLQSWIHEKN